MSRSIPHATEPLLDGTGRLTRAWFAYLSSLSPSEASAALQQQIDRLWQEFQNLPDAGLPKYTEVVGSEPIDVEGTLASGRVVISLADLPDAGGGALLKIVRDEKGRVSGTSDPTTDDLPEGATNLYYTDARAAAAAPVQSVNGKTGDVVLNATDVGADASGAAAAAVAAHVAESDPHPQYTTASEAAAAAPVQSVNSKTGAVVLAAGDVGAQPASANLTSWAGIPPSDKENTGVAVAKNAALNVLDPSLVLWRITAGTSPGADNQSILFDTGLVSASRGAYFRLFGSNHASAPGQIQIISGAGAPIIMSGGILRFNADNAYSFGTSGFRASVLYAATGTINTSDAREKTEVRPLTPQEIAAAIELSTEIGVYQWLEMIAEKGEAGARLHVGMTVQRSIEIMESHGLDPFRYGFICFDEWAELPEVVGEDGEIAQEYRPAGSRYSFRMDELLAFIARGFAHRLTSIEERLAAAGL